MKFLYETTVDKVIETVDIQKDPLNPAVSTHKQVKKLQPIKVALLKPDRKLFKAAEIFYAKTLSEYLKLGLLPYSLVAKRYANDGGPLSESEKERLKTLREEAKSKELAFFGVDAADKDAKEKKNTILQRLNEINTEIEVIQNAYSDIFDSSAEVKTRGDTVEWWSLHLIYWDLDGKGYQPVFSGTYEEKLDGLEKLEDLEDPFTSEVIKKLSYLVSFWLSARNTVTAVDFGTMEKLYVETMSVYHPKASEEAAIVDNSPAPAPAAAQAPNEPAQSSAVVASV